MGKLKAWFNFAKRVWIPLGLGWIAPVVSISCILRLDQAGALLVCSAIVSEVFHDKRHRLFVDQIQTGNKESCSYMEVDSSNHDGKDIEVMLHQTSVGSRIVNASSWALYHLARKEEFYRDENSRCWDLERTMKRAERRVDYAIVITAIIGTILWAFG